MITADNIKIRQQAALICAMNASSDGRFPMIDAVATVCCADDAAADPLQLWELPAAKLAFRAYRRACARVEYVSAREPRWRESWAEAEAMLRNARGAK